MYISGDHWKICDVCGFKYRKSQTRKMWNGLIVCRADFESRHEQDYMVRGVHDKQSVKDARPRPDNVFLEPGDVTADDL